MTIVIRTNNHKRDVLYWYDLSEKEQKEFDWLEDSSTLTTEDATFFRYRGNVYCLEDIEAIRNYPGDDLKGWDGIEGDSFFSGILVKYPREDWGEIDSESVIVASYYCKSEFED